MSKNQDKGKGVGTEPLKRTKKTARRTTPNKYVEGFKLCKFKQTRWPHKPTLEELGLLEDVTAILNNMGLGCLLEMDHLAYPNELAQMMGTFKLKLNASDAPPSLDKLGCITFTVEGVDYELSIKNLCAAYGFKLTHGGKIQPDKDTDSGFWAQIGHGIWKGSRSKASTISNPSVRYVHKVLANTMFSRTEMDRVRDDELHLMVNGLFPMFEDDFENANIGCYEGINLGVMLARQIQHLKLEWVLNQNEKSKIYIGGFLTPIFHACNVPLGPPSTSKKTYIDVEYLKVATFLDKTITDKHVYKFMDANGELDWTSLPNPNATSLQGVPTSFANLRFKYGGAEDVEEEPTRKRAREAPDAYIPQPLPLGSSRYYHSSFKGKVTSGGLRHALDGISMNQRHNKWLSKSLHNVTKGFGRKIKKMAAQIKDLNALVGTYVIGRRTPPCFDDGSTNLEAALDEARSYSVTFPLHAAQVDQGEGSRPSTQASRRHIPTPSPPSSDNELYHYSDSNSE